ncbi:MAG: hypothetical protein NUV60_02300, partial [Patescibacteria group bacterium]|nr:hypothetical protein [Patescibacteria group bacterium]
MAKRKAPRDCGAWTARGVTSGELSGGNGQPSGTDKESRMPFLKGLADDASWYLCPHACIGENVSLLQSFSDFEFSSESRSPRIPRVRVVGKVVAHFISPRTDEFVCSDSMLSPESSQTPPPCLKGVMDTPCPMCYILEGLEVDVRTGEPAELEVPNDLAYEGGMFVAAAAGARE